MKKMYLCVLLVIFLQNYLVFVNGILNQKCTEPDIALSNIQHYSCSKPNFFVTGFQEDVSVTKAESKNCVFDVTFTQTPYKLKLTCHRDMGVKIFPPQQHLTWIYNDETNAKDQTCVYTNNTIEKEIQLSNKETVLTCITGPKKKEITNERIVFNFHYVPATIAPDKVFNKLVYSIQKREVRVADEQTITVTVNLINKSYVCMADKNSYTLLKNKMVTFEINSKTIINHLWCHIGNNKYNIINEIKSNLIETPNLKQYRKQIYATDALKGLLNCTFLGLKDYPIESDSSYIFNDGNGATKYLRTTCNMEINVVDPPKPTTQRVTTVTTKRVTTKKVKITKAKPSKKTKNPVKKTSVTIKPTTKKQITTTKIYETTTFISSTESNKNSSPIDISSRNPEINIDPVEDTKNIYNGTDENNVTGSNLWHSMDLWYGVGALICVILLILVICVVRKLIQRQKVITRVNSDVTYENFGEDKHEQFPPNLETAYARPFDSLSIKENTYATPHVDIYSKPIPKSQRIDQMYSKVLPKNRRNKTESPYAKIKKSNNLVYAEIDSNTNEKGFKKKDEPAYSEIKKADYENFKGYTNVPIFNSGKPYANTSSNVEYVEPAYCELNKTNK